ncbi:N-acetylmuramoyl-L-alanine amidase [Bacillus sp. M6-12]|uniref:N-acetylmuramoyl-L-alanine amidase family protein n=1 Tax=Bacillus sp. M6-12 TaxID=2054166 RepID=UPI000C780BAF|nr:N-acetylmuramoyl-L-alanine amidase [Bacillus sp. M6-12]PLS18657.1 N-acetylmuramoyl-L-alanine amidase [Bacillus sp. M6-12]
MVKIIIDPGHGGKDPGAVRNGLQEKNLVLRISKYMEEYLRANYTGFQLALTRSTDVFIELSKRADIANKLNADVFISNHVNAGGGTGYESFIYTTPSAKTASLQGYVNSEAMKIAGKFGLGAHGDINKRGNLAVLRETNMPAVLTEIGFIDSKDAALLKNEQFLKEMAEAYARGIAKFLELPAKKASPVQGKKYRLYTGTFASKADAEAAAAKIKKDYGYITYIREE